MWITCGQANQVIEVPDYLRCAPGLRRDGSRDDQTTRFRERIVHAGIGAYPDAALRRQIVTAVSA